MTDILDVIKLVADVAVLPGLGIMFSVQGRLSKIEGQLEAMLKFYKGYDQ